MDVLHISEPASYSSKNHFHASLVSLIMLIETWNVMLNVSNHVKQNGLSIVTYNLKMGLISI